MGFNNFERLFPGFYLHHLTPKKSKLQNIVTVTHDGAWREEIEIELRDAEDESYNGTITMQEAKHFIFYQM